MLDFPLTSPGLASNGLLCSLQDWEAMLSIHGFHVTSHRRLLAVIRHVGSLQPVCATVRVQSLLSFGIDFAIFKLSHVK